MQQVQQDESYNCCQLRANCWSQVDCPCQHPCPCPWRKLAVWPLLPEHWREPRTLPSGPSPAGQVLVRKSIERAFPSCIRIISTIRPGYEVVDLSMPALASHLVIPLARRQGFVCQPKPIRFLSNMSEAFSPLQAPTRYLPRWTFHNTAAWPGSPHARKHPSLPDGRIDCYLRQYT